VANQRTENELVAAELELHGKTGSSSSGSGSGNDDGCGPVYKMIGPVLIRQDLDEARSTVQKRLEFIQGEKDRLEAAIADKERDGAALSSKIHAMQTQLKDMTAHAVQAIQQEHGRQTSAS